MEASRNEHFDGRFAFAKHEAGFCKAEPAKKTQDQRFGALAADVPECLKELIHLETPGSGFIGRQSWGRDLERRVRVQRDLGLVPSPSEKECTPAGCDPN
jgi:hypothetical protein